MHKFFGGSPGAVIARLAVISFVVGVILSFLGVSPFDIVDGLAHLARRIYNLGFDAFDWIFRYLLLGGAIVVPIWVIYRIWTLLTNPRGRPETKDNRDTKPGRVP